MSVPGERPDTPGGATADQPNSALPLVASNNEILGWLDILLKGKPEQQVLARTEIAIILEARGHFDDAEEAYWTNVQARCTDRRAYDRLISLYQIKGDRLSESLVRRQLDEVFHGVPRAGEQTDGDDDDDAPSSAGPGAARGPASARPTGPHGPGPNGNYPGGQGTRGPGTRAGRGAPTPGSPTAGGPAVRRVRRLRDPGLGGPGNDYLAQIEDVQPPAPPAPEPPPLEPPPVTATGPGAAAGHAYAAIVHAAMLQAGARTSPPAAASGPPPAVGSGTVQDQPGHPGQPSQAPTPPPSSSPAAAASQAQAAARARQLVVPGQQTAPAPQPLIEPPAVRRRTSPLSPHPEPASQRRRFTTSGLIALEPATIGAFLLASVGAAAIIAFLLIFAERGFSGRSAANTPGTNAPSASAPASAASQLPPRCTDAALRFPGMNFSDPRGSVVAGYRENGVDVDAARPGSARLTPDQAEQVLGGWMAISLLMERSGQQPPTLAGWLDSETDRPTLANAILAGRRVEGMITQDEWATMRGWSPATCEGAFLNDPRNVGAVRLMERVIAR